MIMLRFLVIFIISYFLVAVIFPVQGFAQTFTGQGPIWVSDVDDTIQNTMVHPQKHYLKFAMGLFRNHDAFVGMPALYTLIASRGFPVVYVSGAPRIISFLPEKFLQTSGFPVGDLNLRPSTSEETEEFKFQKIKSLMKQNPSRKFILVGDNGERDVQSYYRLQQDPEVKSQVQAVFIHLVYSESIGSPLAPGQRPFTTSADLAIDLYRMNLLNTNELTISLRIVSGGLESRYKHIRERSFPYHGEISEQEMSRLQTLGIGLKDPEHVTLWNKIASRLYERFQKQNSSPLQEFCLRALSFFYWD